MKTFQNISLNRVNNKSKNKKKKKKVERNRDDEQSHVRHLQTLKGLTFLKLKANNFLDGRDRK